MMPATTKDLPHRSAGDGTSNLRTVRYGVMSDRLGNGLQNRSAGFDSRSRLATTTTKGCTMTITKQRLAVLGLLALTIAGIVTMSMPVYETSMLLVGGIRLSVAALMAFLWAAWFRAETREDNS